MQIRNANGGGHGIAPGGEVQVYRDFVREGYGKVCNHGGASRREHDADALLRAMGGQITGQHYTDCQNASPAHAGVVHAIDDDGFKLLVLEPAQAGHGQVPLQQRALLVGGFPQFEHPLPGEGDVGAVVREWRSE